MSRELTYQITMVKEQWGLDEGDNIVSSEESFFQMFTKWVMYW